MRAQEMTCIVCPMGCRLTVMEDGGAVTVSGNTCKRGEAYGRQEFVNPMRVVTTSIRLEGGARPVVSVKTRGQVPKAKIPEVLARCRAARLTAPVRIGDTAIENVAETGVPVVVTSNA